MKKRVKDLNIEINLNKLNNILKNIIDEKYLNSIKYGYVGSSSYSKLLSKLSSVLIPSSSVVFISIIII